ncbi:MAG: DUF1802 family protein [Planctomycetia bacterium]|nr:DUF1802 family protein [Planctomycetia bacterium]
MNPGETDTLPTASGIAFKEWEGVCEALTTGRQSLILRKGGIEEGPGGFSPDHRAFWLYPTRVHQAAQGLKPGPRRPPDPAPQTPEGTIGLRGFAVVALIGRIDSAERLSGLDDLHVWTAETVGQRFQYRHPGLWVLGVRILRPERPVPVPEAPEHAGCKTWVRLGVELPTAGLVPVLDGPTFGAEMDRLRSLVESPATP